MTNNEFKQVLLDDSVLMSKQELEEIIENELNKSESEMDADLIEYCLDSIKKLQLSEESNKKEESKKVFFINPKMWRVLVAMSVVLTFIFAVTASAIYFNIPENIAQLIDGNAEMVYPLENVDTTADGYALLETDFAKELESFGITPVTFPEALVSDECKITKIENTTTDKRWSLDAEIDFIYNGQKCSMKIWQSMPYDAMTGVGSVMDVKAATMINVNGLDVLVFEQKHICIIKYTDGLTDYDIDMECDFETAKEFAKTIK